MLFRSLWKNDVAVDVHDYLFPFSDAKMSSIASWNISKELSTEKNICAYFKNPTVGDKCGFVDIFAVHLDLLDIGVWKMVENICDFLSESIHSSLGWKR